MTIVRCPRCRDEVTMPAKAPLTALVRCPLCYEKYLLSEAAAQLPPTLIMVVSELEPKAAEPQTANDAPDAGEYRLGEIQGGLIDTQASFRPPVRLPQRLPRKEKNALVELVKIVGGGILGLGLGILVLWWALRQDPLELGPVVSGYAPWIVPVRFHARATSPAVTITKTPGRITASSNKRVEGASGTDAKTISAGKKAEAPSQPATVDSTLPARSMPDLTDLLPDGPSPDPMLPLRRDSSESPTVAPQPSPAPAP
jgi:hypothetical protein